MPDKTKIVFPGGHELVVDAEPSQVLDLLQRNEPFHQSKTTDGVDVYIAHDRVAYLEQVPEVPRSVYENRLREGA
jgi:hypothetical protein